MRKKVATLLGVLLVLALAIVCIAGCGPKDSAKDGTYGGTLNVALARTAPHYDTDKSTDSYSGQVIFHVYEGLFEIDENYKPQPYLAESYEVQDDGKTYVFKLREGVLFHNGNEMTSEDVLASFERWLKNNGGGQQVEPYVDKAEATDKYEFVVKFKEQYAPFLSFLSSIVSNQKFVVRPKEIIEKFGDKVIEDHIGTGPYKMVEYVPDDYVKLERFEEYVAQEGPSFAYSGKKEAYCDEIVFRIVPEPAVRVAGVKTGQYHYAELAPRDEFEQLEEDPDVVPYLVTPFGQSFIIVNMGYPPFDNVYARQALLHALDVEELAKAMLGDEKFWYLDGALFPEGHIWHVSNAGKGSYNAYDPEKAKELLDKAGYNGEQVIILNGRDDPMESRGAEVARDQLEKVGFNVDTDLPDRATVVERREQLDSWNLHFNTFFTPDPDPQVYGAWMGTDKWIGNWNDEDSVKMDDIFERMLREIDYDKRGKIVEEWHEAFYEYVPYVKNFFFNEFNLAHKSLKGYEPFTVHVFFNVWLEE